MKKSMMQKELDRELIVAASQGNLGKVARLLERGARIDAAIGFGERPLHYAAGNGFGDVVKLLIARGAKIDATDESGRQPLHRALSNGREDMAELLVAKGAPVDAGNIWGLQPIHYARSSRGIDLLVAKGADINARDDDGDTPLHHVVRHDYLQTVMHLLRIGADPMVLNNEGEMPLDLCRDAEIEVLLRKASLEWERKSQAAREMQEREALSEHLARQRQLGSLRPKAPAL